MGQSNDKFKKAITRIVSDLAGASLAAKEIAAIVKEAF